MNLGVDRAKMPKQFENRLGIFASDSYSQSVDILLPTVRAKESF